MVALSIKKNIPNILTIIRIALSIPIIVLMMLNSFSICYSIELNTNNIINIDWNSIIVLILFIIACITDWLDGYLSRKYNWISVFGKILDPIADKVIINSIFILFAIQTKTNVAFVIAFIIRDIVVDAIRMYASSKNIVIAANFLGKLKTVLQMLAIIIMLVLGCTINSVVSWWYWSIQNLFVYFSLLISIVSGIVYIISFIKINKSAKK